MRLGITAVLLVSFFSFSCAQHFKGQLVAGLNFSQLDGDNLQGFDKLGLHGGMRISRDLTKSTGMAIELLINQKGSATSIKFGSPGIDQRISLDYLSVPVLFYVNEWYLEDWQLHKILIEGGLIFNRLFGVRSTNSFYDNRIEDFRDFDLGGILGLSYRFSQKWSVSIRYERSFLKIFQRLDQDIRGLQSYLFNFRMGYSL